MKRDKRVVVFAFCLFAVILLIGSVSAFSLVDWIRGLFGGKDVAMAPGDCFCYKCEKENLWDKVDGCYEMLMNRSCRTVYLTQNIIDLRYGADRCINLENFDAEGKVFDCSRFNITGFRYHGLGKEIGAIRLTNVSNLVIRNCGLDSFHRGIKIWKSFNINLTNIRFNERILPTFSQNIIISSSSNIGLNSIILKHYTDWGLIIGDSNRISLNNVSACGRASHPSVPDIIIRNSTITQREKVYCNSSWGMFCNYFCNGTYVPQECYCNSCASCSNQLNNQSCIIVKLTQNIVGSGTGCINNPLRFNNKIFDCQGYSINQSSRTGYLINLNGKNGNTIKNCTLYNSLNAINLVNSNHTSIVSSILIKNHIGMTAEKSNNLTISRSKISNNTQKGLSISAPLSINFNILLDGVKICDNQDKDIFNNNYIMDQLRIVGCNQTKTTGVPVNFCTECRWFPG
jgi:hypothetical protein